MAHELGHNLGSDHDGEAGIYKNCTANDGYIMAPTVKIGLNTNKFSSCSIQAIKSFIVNDGLPFFDVQCLAETKNDSIYNETLTKGTVLGELWNPDEQCKIVFGNNASFCKVM